MQAFRRREPVVHVSFTLIKTCDSVTFHAITFRSPIPATVPAPYRATVFTILPCFSLFRTRSIRSGGDRKPAISIPGRGTFLQNRTGTRGHTGNENASAEGWVTMMNQCDPGNRTPACSPREAFYGRADCADAEWMTRYPDKRMSAPPASAVTGGCSESKRNASGIAASGSI